MFATASCHYRAAEVSGQAELTTDSSTDRVQDLELGCPLDDVSDRAGVDHLHHGALVFVGGERHHRRFGLAAANRASGGGAASGHANIQPADIRLALGGDLGGRGRAVGLAHDFHIVGVGDRVAYGRAETSLVIADHDPNLGHLFSGFPGLAAAGWPM